MHFIAIENHKIKEYSSKVCFQMVQWFEREIFINYFSHYKGPNIRYVKFVLQS